MWKLDDLVLDHITSYKHCCRSLTLYSPHKQKLLSVPIPSCSVEASVEAIQAEVASKEQSQGMFFHWFVTLKVTLALGQYSFKSPICFPV